MQNRFIDFLRETFSIRAGTDVRGTIDSIRSNIMLKGYNVWLLITSALIASVGLDMNSPAVIIGAMLISPLMSPILGVGLSIGINDRGTLFKSLENLGIAAVASLVTSSLYFLISPFAEANNEIMARTSPTLLDVGVGFFGGVAGIVSISRKEKTNAIPGVAIATALMPPICVSGFGLAKGEWTIFAGAFYLFFLNAVFIALSTYLIVRFLNFPYMEFVDEATQRKVTRWMALFVVVLIIPSGWLLYEVLTDLRTKQRVEKYVQEVINDDYHRALSHQIAKGKGVADTLEIVMTGSEYIDTAQANILLEKLHEPPYKLSKFALNLRQLNDPKINWDDYFIQTENKLKAQVAQMLETKAQAIDARDSLIQKLKLQQDSLIRAAYGFQDVEKELRVLYPDIENITYSFAYVTNFEKQDTLPQVVLEWDKRRVSSTTRSRYNQTIGLFLQQRMNLDTVKVVGN